MTPVLSAGTGALNMAQPRLIATHSPASPSAAVLVLHGGAGRGDSVVVSPTQLSVIRMIPIARRVARVGRGQLAVFRLLNATRGWDTHHTPVDDARWALSCIHEQLGDLPVGLIGHSLGGRAALLAAGEPTVRSVVALAPWVYPTDNPGGLAGRRILVVHGSADRVASQQRSFALAWTLARTADVGYIQIDGAKHAMLRHHRQFDSYAASFTAAVLCPDTKNLPIPEPVRHVLDGGGFLTV
jgi:pimeloyl-ACP methyl ester carboxylesterase